MASRAEIDIISSISEYFKVSTGQSTELFKGFYRYPFEITCDSWSEQAKTILWKCNPGEAVYQLKQRASVQPIKSGSAYYYWPDIKRKTSWDEPTVQYTFQTGNIRPIRRKGGELVFPEGLSNFNAFMQLIDEPKIFNGDLNMVSIMHTSPMFPRMILRGIFLPESISWNESASGDAIVTWQATFLVKRAIPDFYTGNFFGKSEGKTPTVEALKSFYLQSYKSQVHKQ